MIHSRYLKNIKYEEFERNVKEVLANHPEVYGIAMTDDFYDYLCSCLFKTGYRMSDFRRMFGLPIMVVENNSLTSDWHGEVKFEDFRYLGLRIKMQ